VGDLEGLRPPQKIGDLSGLRRRCRAACRCLSGKLRQQDRHRPRRRPWPPVPVALPARSPNLNAHAERWVRSVKEECLSKVILFGERSLRRALSDYVEHYHTERNHQGRENVLLFPRDTDAHREAPARCRQRLGGLLRYYHQAAA